MGYDAEFQNEENLVIDINQEQVVDDDHGDSHEIEPDVEQDLSPDQGYELEQEEEFDQGQDNVKLETEFLLNISNKLLK